MLLGLRKCSLHKPINYHGPSHKYYPLSPHNIQLGLSQKYSSYYYQNWATKLHYSHTKPKESPKFQKFHYDVANSISPIKMWLIQSPTTMWLLPKPATMRHYLQSPLLHGNTLQNLKIISTKPKFLFGIYFYKAQIPIWHLFSQNPNSNLALLYKAQILFWQLSLHSFIKPKY